ncbi:MAG TPA: [LysW]-lysine hydrolase [Candidatus Dormibacteraeota bacterium]|nr:[LysW]-lysine hydrolase [Candidatus Dormibacteraeota bacterium]
MSATAIDGADRELVLGLVRIPSVSTREQASVEYLVARMRERGFAARVDEAGNAVGEIGDGAMRIALVGHIDTVPGEIPVAIDDGDLVGRGAVDAKGALAAFVAAATTPPRGARITVVGAVEEEHPSSRGARHLARARAPDYCVVGEPSGWDAITVGYKGSLQLRIEVRRPARHGAHEGASVAEEGIALYAELKRRAAARGAETTPFQRLDCRLASFVAGPSDGLVERAELIVAYRVPPGMTTDEVVADARGVAPTFDVLSAEEPIKASRATPLARAFQSAIREAGGDAHFKVKTGTSDMNVLGPAWRCPIVAYGPGDSRYDHTPMERLPLADYTRSIAVLRGVLARLAGAAG